MKKSRFKKGFAGLMATLMCAMSVPATTAFAADQQDKGKTSDGYDYEMWNQWGQGQVSFNPGTNGSFSCSWSNIENFLGRTGRKLTDKKPYSTYGTITVDYDVDYKPDGNSYMCIYGWTEDPTVEYYIVQAWGTWRPPGQQGGGLGTFSSDGSTYNIYKSTRVNQPSIHGTETFDQYWSVNTTNPAKAYSSTHLTGTITVSDHFKKWEGAGLKMGTLWEVSLNIEGYQSNGSAKVNKNKLTMNASTNPNQTTNPSTTPSTPATPNEPKNSDGSYWKTDFESSTGDWVARGTGTKIATDSSNHVGGSKGLAVTGRGDKWHGAQVELDSSDFVGGNSYSFSVAAMQNSGSSETLKMTLQYSLGGEENYDEVASAKAASGEWVKLENTSFKIPSGATNLVLYVEAPDGTSDFYIDDAMAAKSGTKSSINLSNASSSTPATNPNPNTNTNPNTNPNPNTNNSASTNFNTSDPGLKDYFSKYFKIGTSVSPNELGSGASFLKKNYNSITPENELKPDAIIDQQASMQKGNNVNTQVNLSRAANTLKFCEENGISLRGHTFVWYSQTPDWFFKENFSDNGNWVSKQVMDQRLESFIKNTFEAIAKQYPKLDLYSYDVCNELFKNDGGGMRPSRAQDPSQGSRWVQIYGDDSFVLNAFKYARKYAPANCKLYLNDYNEYIGAKTTDIYNMALKVKAEGNIDGIGMQSHLATNYPDKNTYSAALDKFLSTGLDVQITELDITCSDFQSQASLYKDIFTLAMNASTKYPGRVPALTIWGTQDPVSWRSSQNPLLFSSGYKPKPAYDAVIGLVDSSDIGKTNNASVVQTPTNAPAQTPTSAPNNTNNNPSVSADADFGDVTLDGSVGLSDALAILQYVANAQKFPLTEKAINNGDVYNRGDGITAADALSIQKYDAKVITKLPESWSANATANTNTNNNASSNTNNNNSSASTNTGSVKAISSSFESGKDGWAARGDVTVESDSDNYYSGSKSLKISNRGDAWQGLGYELGSDFKAGGTYSFSAAVLQGSGSAETMKMSLQYDDASGVTQYDQIATASAADKTWTKLENTEYTIPSGATNLLLYIESDTSLTDIYVDDVFAGDKGTASKVTTGGGKVNITAASTPSVNPSTGNTSIDPSKPMIAISFDDGCQKPAIGTRIVDALSKSGFHATFFYVGDWIGAGSGENEVKYAYSKGMEIANHTTSHPHLPQLGASQIRSEFDNTHAKLKNIIGAEPSKLMRLPYLESNGTVESTLNDVALISCQFDTQDWNGHSKDQIVNDIKGWVTSGQGNGAIVLCHETYDATASAMEEVLPWIKSQGWQVVTISEMAAAKGKTLSGGRVYKTV